MGYKLKYITAVLLYGTIGLMVRFIALPTDVIVLCRGAIGSLSILIFSRAAGRRMESEAVKRNLPWLILSGVCLGLNWVLLFAAYRYTTVAVASLCNYMAPILVLLVAPFLLHERMTRKKGLCVAAAFLGIVLVSGVPEGGAETFRSGPGILLGLGAALAFAAIVLCNKKLRSVPVYDKALVQLFVSALTVLPYALLHNRGVALQPDALSVVLVAVLGVVHTGAAYCLYFGAMGELPVQTIAILGYIEPVMSVLCSALILKEPLTVWGAAGAALIIGAAAIRELTDEK